MRILKRLLYPDSCEMAARYPAYRNYKEVRKMGMFDPKKRKIITAVIAIILALAMVIPTVLSMVL